jgi:hypothetical protein
MRSKVERHWEEGEKAVRDIRRAIRRQYSAEQKVRIVIAGLRGEDTSQSCAARRAFSKCATPINGKQPGPDSITESVGSRLAQMPFEARAWYKRWVSRLPVLSRCAAHAAGPTIRLLTTSARSAGMRSPNPAQNAKQKTLRHPTSVASAALHSQTAQALQPRLRRRQD